MTTIERLAASCGDSDLDRLIAEREYFRLATGRTDEQVDADGAREVEVERQMAATPATNIGHVVAKLTAYVDGAFGGAIAAHPLLASAIADLNRLDHADSIGESGKAAMLASDLHGSLEALAGRLDSLAGAAGALGNTMGAANAPGDSASLAYTAEFILESLHRDVAELIDDAGRLRRAVGGAA